MPVPVFREGDTPQDWCELTAFTCHALRLGQHVALPRRAAQERLLVTEGRFFARGTRKAQILRAGQFLDLAPDEAGLTIEATTETAECLHLSGTWGDDIAGCGIWTLEETDSPHDAGDPVTYPKRTRMDRHYHDYDEYWFILDGAAKAVVGDETMDVTAGDCVAIRAGHAHDMPEVAKPMRGAFFETTLLGRKRLGHLWEHTHGPAIAAPLKVSRPAD